MSKNDFFIGLDHLTTAAKNALKDLPEDMGRRERSVAERFLSRIPEQVEDIKSFIEDPHKRTHPSDIGNRIIDPFS